MDAIRATGIAGISPSASEVGKVAEPKPTTPFSEHVRNALAQTNQVLNAADAAAGGLASGETDSVEAVLALTKAELALRHTVAMSTRMLEAYREVMRLQL
ncbi:MAG: flagellar hook-basal body complex protein FliE [Myxococcales bacterium]|nr:flagellar hook-basal body complex protein FliE [Myxococcales bacterium]